MFVFIFIHILYLVVIYVFYVFRVVDIFPTPCCLPLAFCLPLVSMLQDELKHRVQANEAITCGRSCIWSSQLGQWLCSLGHKDFAIIYSPICLVLAKILCALVQGIGTPWKAFGIIQSVTQNVIKILRWFCPIRLAKMPSLKGDSASSTTFLPSPMSSCFLHAFYPRCTLSDFLADFLLWLQEKVVVGFVQDCNVLQGK